MGQKYLVRPALIKIYLSNLGQEEDCLGLVSLRSSPKVSYNVTMLSTLLSTVSGRVGGDCQTLEKPRYQSWSRPTGVTVTGRCTLLDARRLL